MTSKIDAMSSRQPEIDSNENKAVFDQSRAALYHLLSVLYLQEVTPDLLDTLHQSGFFEISADVNIPFPKLEEDTSDLCRLLEAEYARLFVGPGKCVPPYGSVHREDDSHPGTLWGSTTTEVKRFMEHYGLKIDTPGSIPDHIGVLFEFMAALIDGKIKADGEGDNESIKTAESLQRRFFAEYIHPWVDNFLTRVDQIDPEAFYKATVELTRLLMEQDRELLMSDLSE